MSRLGIKPSQFSAPDKLRFPGIEMTSLRLMMKLFIELCKPPEQRQLSMFPRFIDEYFPTLLQCKEQQEQSLTTKQLRKHTKSDNLARLNIESWNGSVSNPLEKKQITLNKSGILLSRLSGSMRNMTELGKEQNGKRKATLDMAPDQEPRPKRHAVRVDLALIHPDLQGSECESRNPRRSRHRAETARCKVAGCSIL